MKKSIRLFFVLVLAAALVVPQAGLFFRKNMTPSVAAEEKIEYISELKVGYSYPDESADAGAKALEGEGYTVLVTGDGEYADLAKQYNNFDKRNHVYLGYKTTTDPKEAITDICFMLSGDEYVLQNGDPTVAEKRYVSQLEDHIVNGQEPIPRSVIIEWYDNERYEAVTCNRREGKTAQEKERYKAQGDAADLLGDGAGEWIALYVARDENEEPVLADSFQFSDDSNDYYDSDMYGAHLFENYYVDGKAWKDIWPDNICRWEDQENEVNLVLILHDRSGNTVKELVSGIAKDAGADKANVAGSTADTASGDAAGAASDEGATTAGSMISGSFTWIIVSGVAALAIGLIIGLLIGSKRSKQHNS